MKKATIAIVILTISALFLFIVFGKLIPKPEPPHDNTEDDWIYPKSDDANPIWGIKNGIVFGTESTEMDNKPAGVWAKGLLRIGWADEEGKSHFFNYIGLSLIRNGKQVDASEIERITFHPDSLTYASGLDVLLSEYFEDSTEVQDYLSLEKNPAASLSQVTNIEDDEMSVLFRLSTFQFSKAKIYLIIVVDKSVPREIKISVYNQEEETNPLDFIIVSATYGNLARLRDLYLRYRIVNARELFEGYELGAWCFYPRVSFDLDELMINEENAVTVYAGNDEEGDWVADLGNEAPYYDGPRFFQYWRKYAGSYGEDFQVSVNGREKYFGGFFNPCGHINISGGVSYENFEMVEEYYHGQTFWFGFDYTVEY
ncbi:MAG: hypothetical protein OEZ25_02015 [Candidatus Bathyarchaeota archaeon]|nr:hypothetical protein [Candidatus Bathyarchaeota archaeon]